jgi:hypothetical protein
VATLTSLPEDDERVFGDEVLTSPKSFGTPQENVRILASMALPDTLELDRSEPDGWLPERAPAAGRCDHTLPCPVVGRWVSDGIGSNDKKFPSAFPYFAPLHQPLGKRARGGRHAGPPPAAWGRPAWERRSTACGSRSSPGGSWSAGCRGPGAQA